MIVFGAAAVSTSLPEAVTSTSSITPYYEGFLASGFRFDYTLSPSTPYGPVKLGTSSVIAGWDQGLVGMKVGGKRQLIIPPELAYGPYGAGQVPPNAVTVFTVEIVSATP